MVHIVYVPPSKSTRIIGTDLGTRKGSVQVGQIADCAVTKSWEHRCSSYVLHNITRQSGMWPALLATPRLFLREGDKWKLYILQYVFQLLLKNLSLTLKPRHKEPIGYANASCSTPRLTHCVSIVLNSFKVKQKHHRNAWTAPMPSHAYAFYSN